MSACTSKGLDISGLRSLLGGGGMSVGWGLASEGMLMEGIQERGFEMPGMGMPEWAGIMGRGG